jgi:hypothetical protein
MKIRIKGNSIRLRLTKSEVDTLATTGMIEEKTEFDDNSFGYKLQTKNGINTLDAIMDNNTMTVLVPEKVAVEWPDNTIVSHTHTKELKNGKSLLLLVEKDFKCIDAPPHEDQSDNYENPLLSCR